MESPTTRDSLLASTLGVITDLEHHARAVNRILKKITNGKFGVPTISGTSQDTLLLQEIKKTSAGIIKLIGGLASLSALLDTMDDPGTISDRRDLSCLRACEQSFRSLENLISASGPSTRFPDMSDLGLLQESILGTLICLELASFAKDLPTVLARLSEVPSLEAPPPEANRIILFPSRLLDEPAASERILRHLIAYDYSDLTFRRLLARRCESTTGWILKHDSVLTWLAGNERALWMHGEAGCGKSTITASIVEHLLRSIATPTTAILYCFIEHFTECSKSLHQILGTLLVQLLRQSQSAYEMALEYFHISPGKPTQNEEEFHATNFRQPRVLTGTLEAVLEDFERTFIVIDGLDDLDDSTLQGLMPLLARLYHAGGSVKLLLVSREIQLFREDPGLGLRNDSCESYMISADPEDIKMFIQTSTNQLVSRRPGIGFSEQEIQEIAESLLRCKNFRYAEFHLARLLEMDMEEKRRLHLRSLPASLDQSYRSLLDTAVVAEDTADASGEKERLPGNKKLSGREWLRVALGWTLYLTYRPRHRPSGMQISRRILFDALSIAMLPEADRLHELEPIGNIEDRLTRCLSGLMATDSLDGSLVVHRTVAEFLMKPESEGGFGITMQDAGSSLAVVALRVLNFLDLDREPQEVKVEQLRGTERHAEHPFYNFAAGWWPELARSAEWATIEALATRLFDLKAPRGRFLTWFLEYCDCHFPWRYKLRTLPSTEQGVVSLVDGITSRPGEMAFRIAASLGLSDLCRSLITQQPDMKGSLGKREWFLGSLLLAAVLGPDAWSLGEHHWHQSPAEFYYPRHPDSTNVVSLDQAGTMRMLLEVGASCTAVVNLGKDWVSMASNALMTCVALEDPLLFLELLHHGMQLDHHFAGTLEDIRPPCPGLRPDDQAVGRVARWEPKTLARCHPRVLSEGQAFCLNRICLHLIDWNDSSTARLKPLPYKVTAGSEPIYAAAWYCATEFDLEVCRRGVMRRIDCTDMEFDKLRSSVLREFSRNHILRLLQDPRFDVNQPVQPPEASRSGVDESLGQTALHLAAEDGSVITMEHFLAHNGELSVRDGVGRTPLHVSDTPAMVRLLLERGADIRAVDASRRSIWHYAAANNDTLILEVLLEFDDDIPSALKQVTNDGRTPMAEALAVVIESGRMRHRILPKGLSPAAANLLLPHCQGDPAYFISNIPAILLTVEWANIQLLKDVVATGAVDARVVSEAQASSTAFHCLSFRASKSFVQLLRKVCGEDLLTCRNSENMTAAEIIFFSRANADDDDEEDDHGRGPSPPRSRSSRFKLDTGMYKLLLTPEVVKSRDSEGKTLWERFCDNVITTYCDQNSTERVADPVCKAVEALITADALEEYENGASKSALLPMVTSIWAKSRFIPPFIARLALLVLRNTRFFENVKDMERILLTLRWAVAGSQVELAEALMSRGTSPHLAARGMTVFEEVCLPGPYDLTMFRTVLKYIDKSRLNAYNQYGRAAIHTLVCDGDTGEKKLLFREEKLSGLLTAGADPNLRSEDGMPAVVLATIKNQEECAIILLDRGADVKACLHDGLDVTLAASSRGCTRVLRKIRDMAIPDWDWKRLASVTMSMVKESWRKTVFHGCHPLHLAAMNSQVPALRFFLEGNGENEGEGRTRRQLIPVDEPCRNQKLTAMHFAAMGGGSDGVRYLALQGANINAQDAEGLTPLHYAAKLRYPEVVRSLLGLGCERNPVDKFLLTPLLIAIQSNFRPCIDMLLHEGEVEGVGRGRGAATAAMVRPLPISTDRHQVRQKIRFLAEALETAVTYRDAKITLAVLNLGCPIDVAMPSCKGCTALTVAIRMPKPEIVKLLLAKGATKMIGNCPRHGSKGISGVFDAVIKPERAICLLDVLDAALRLGLNWFASRVTPLHIAAQSRNSEAMGILLRHLEQHAEAYLKWLPDGTIGLDEKPSLMVSAPLSSSPETETRQRHDGGEGESNDERAGGSSTKQSPPSKTVHPVVRYMVRRRIQIPQSDAEHYASDSNHATPLHLAAHHDSPEMCRLLVEHGADVNALDMSLATPLYRAVGHECARTVAFLVAQRRQQQQQAACRLDLRDELGRTPLTRAVRLDSLSLCRTLVDAGADTSVLTPEDGTSLLGLAGQRGSPALFRYLCEEVGLNPYARNRVGFCPLREALLNTELTAYALSGRFDLWRAAEGPDVEAGLLSIAAEQEGMGFLLARLHRRWPPGEWARYVNTAPASSPSALCVAAAREYDWCVEFLLRRAGADPEVEGCAEGTALMAAASLGRLGAVEALVRVGGARVAYVSPRDGLVRDAVGLAGRGGHDKVKAWLLVGRWTDQPKIADAAAWQTGGGAGGGGGGGGGAEVRPWSGVAQVRWACTGTKQDHGVSYEESMFASLLRVADVKRGLRGTVVVPFRGS